VGEAYKGFIPEFFPAGYDADGLYESLRNGLVHLCRIRWLRGMNAMACLSSRISMQVSRDLVATRGMRVELRQRQSK
jgi:hypothetical protein